MLVGWMGRDARRGSTNILSEYVKSIINFHPRNQNVDFDGNSLEMSFSFQCTIYDKGRWLNTKLFKKRDVIGQKRQYVYCAQLYKQCIAVLFSDWSLHMGPKMTPGALTMSGDDFPGALEAPRV